MLEIKNFYISRFMMGKKKNCFVFQTLPSNELFPLSLKWNRKKKSGVYHRKNPALFLIKYAITKKISEIIVLALTYFIFIKFY